MPNDFFGIDKSFMYNGIELQILLLFSNVKSVNIIDRMRIRTNKNNRRLVLEYVQIFTCCKNNDIIALAIYFYWCCKIQTLSSKL